jgi:antibiotic biosynthesis monooxygenase (ABM) superfamily enzyme
MITCHIRYVIDPSKIAEFEEYCRMWLKLVPKFGGVHHGYLLPSEGASNIALASFSFESLAKYEQYRIQSLADPECQVAFKYSKETKCFLSYERTFFRPLFN